MTKLDQIKYTFFLRLFTFTKIPLLCWVRPSVIEFNDQKTILKIPLGRRSKNHLGTMYFGALSMGGEAAVAAKAIQTIRSLGKPVDFVFKDFQANFYKRAEGDAHFVCESGDELKKLVQKCITSGERENQTFESYAIIPAIDKVERVATFKVTLSVKLRQKKNW